MKLLLAPLFAVLAYLIYGIYLSNIDLSVTHEINTPQIPYFDYRGAFNVRTSLSDGVRDFWEVIREAQGAELDFLVLSEFYQADLKAHPAGYYNKLFVLGSTEYSYLDSRILVVGTPPLKSEEMSYRLSDWLSEPNTKSRKEFVSLLAPLNAQGTLSWKSEWPVGLEGLEVLNPRVLSERVYLQNPLTVAWSFIIYPFNPQYAFLRLFEDPEDELALWDSMAEKKSLHGFAGLDVSGRAILIPGNYFEFPSYQTMFWLLSTHVLTRQELIGEYERDFAIFMKSIKSGNMYFALEMLGNPKGVIFYVQDQDKMYLIGDSFSYRSGQKLIYEIPPKVQEIAEINIYRHGQKIAQLVDKKGEFTIPGPGIYRMTIRVPPIFPFPDQRKWVTWIYTNPFYVTER